jgi:hypothetical protein
MKIQKVTKSPKTKKPIHLGKQAKPRCRTKFHLFLQLPPELRLAIFKFALPNYDGRIINVSPHPIHAESDLDIRFTLCSTYFSGSWVPDHSLASVCKESRLVFLQYFKGYLPTPLGGIIRFDDTTIIHITDFDGLLFRNKKFRQIAKTLEGQTPTCLATIRNLALCCSVLRWYSNIAKTAGFPGGLRQILSPFTSVSEIFGVVNWGEMNDAKIRSIKDQFKTVEGEIGTKVTFAKQTADSRIVAF